MQLTTVKPVLIGVGAAAAVIAVTGAAAASGVVPVFKLGETNRVNATSGLTGSTKNSMLAVTNDGGGPALGLHVSSGKAPLIVNSSARVANLNASLLSGLAAGQFVQGGGESRSFGFTMPVPTSGFTQKTLLSLPGFGTLNALCLSGSPQTAQVTLHTGPNAMDRFGAAIENLSLVSVGNGTVTPNTNWLEAQVNTSQVNGLWEQQVLRYTTGSGASLITHMATVNILVDVASTSCDFDASAILGPGVKGP
jgi:hypothetical protein